jgi:hypothetical protein
MKDQTKTYKEICKIDMFLNIATFLDSCYKRLIFLSAFKRHQAENCVVEEGLWDKVKVNNYT